MEKIIQQQILLFTGTHFSSRQCFQGRKPEQKFSEADELQEACWNGLLKEMLPEIWEEDDKNLYLWQIKENKTSIDIEIGELPDEVDDFSSIDPYAFVETLFLN
ncbi:MAG TPA: hypothetical protein VN722_08720 [Hanamia sp.]|nr:hypothetical protein [Hanamia sp.]